MISLPLNLSWRRPLSYRNQSIDLRSNSLDWFLYDNGLHHERVKCFQNLWGNVSSYMQQKSFSKLVSIRTKWRIVTTDIRIYNWESGNELPSSVLRIIKISKLLWPYCQYISYLFLIEFKFIWPSLLYGIYTSNDIFIFTRPRFFNKLIKSLSGILLYVPRLNRLCFYSSACCNNIFMLQESSDFINT